MIATANAIIRPAISFGIMPAPGDEMVPNGRSPLSANTSTPSSNEEDAGDVIGAEGHARRLVLWNRMPFRSPTPDPSPPSRRRRGRAMAGDRRSARLLAYKLALYSEA